MKFFWLKRISRMAISTSRCQTSRLRHGFNLGIKGLMKFKNMISCLLDEDFEGAAYEIKTHVIILK
ncbi:MAG: hypothetical protein CM15mV144_120 [Caudoviricetes sp.]|nr:MAG: hypothetical protein CM15mV144_120 [Caudoviricetes sp.]